MNYDVEDALAQQKTWHHSTSLLKNLIEDEPSTKSPCTLANSVTGVKSDELFSTYNESVTNTSERNESNINGYGHNQQEQNPQTTPKKNNSSYFVYHTRSPSILIKSSSVLSTRFDDNNQANRSTCNTNKTTNEIKRSPKTLSSKLSILNSQISLSKHLEDLDEIKENLSSPFATANINNNQNNQFQPEVDLNCDTDFSEDDIFTTCKTSSVCYQNNYFSNVIC